MTATRTQSRKPGQRRIIERPRLINVLESTEARTILLLAPAGYGKTTLARQWAKSLNGVLALKLSSAHRDVSDLAVEIAARISDSAETYLRTYVEARSNPQREARDIARAVAGQLGKSGIQWLVLDDYHEVVASHEAEVFFESLHGETDCRVLIASRVRPRWTDSRLAVYGELAELTGETLAMSFEESSLVLGSRRGLEELLARTEGWPAAIGLAAASGVTTFEGGADLPSSFHSYLTDELYRSAPEQLQQGLLRLALAPDMEEPTLRELFGDQRERIVEHAKDLGFLSQADNQLELHPLFRDYLFERIAAHSHASEMVDTAIEEAARQERWVKAFELIVRFERLELVEGVLERGYAPLLRTGKLGTLAAFAAALRTVPSLPPPVVDLAEGELALRDGSFEKAAYIVKRVVTRMQDGHPLLSRAYAIAGQSAFVRADLPTAESAYRKAFESAGTEEDEAEALRGWALASIQGEVGDDHAALDRLLERSDRSPMDLLRYSTVSLVSRRFHGGLQTRPPEIDEGQRAAQRVRDPRALSSFAYSATYALGLRAEYDEATTMMDTTDQIIAEYDLDFARPYTDWNRAWIAIGQRRFGNAERALQRIEDALATKPLAFHLINCRILRARLALQTGGQDDALSHLPATDGRQVIPSIYGEYLATRALALAVSGRAKASLLAAAEAERATSAAEVRALAAAARAIAGKQRGADLVALWHLCESLGTWDPLIAALRSSLELADRVAECESIRPSIAQLYERSNDLGLARKAGLRVRSSRNPEDLLTPRELEVLGMLAQGLRNNDIARALFVTQSTVKVHVRHIFEKLGVRTRTEAAARFGSMP